MSTCRRGCCVADTPERAQAAHYRGVTLNPAGPLPQTTFERQLDVDRPAYKRMKDEGLQPARVKGAAAMEARAESRFEIESGRILPAAHARVVDEAVKTAAQIQQAS